MEVELHSNNSHHEEFKSSSNNDVTTKLDQSIIRIIEKEGFIKYTIDKQCVSTNGGNYLGTLYEVDVKGKTKDGDKELNMFVKQIVDMGSFQIVSILDAYSNELFVYKELTNIFTTLQESANVPLEERYKMVKVYDESNREAIIMENMTRKGFTIHYRMNLMSLQFLEVSVKHLARFHALSFVLKEKEPEYFEAKIKSLKHPVILKDDFEELVKTTKEKILAQMDEDLKDKIHKAFIDIRHKYAHNLNDESIKTCLCHGDYRPNNILIKLNKGEVQELVPVDYQVIHYGSPVLDLLYLIYYGTDRSFRQAHMSNLKDLYYETLSSFLKYFNIDADMVYPRKDFEKVYKERFEFGLIIGLLSTPFLFASEDHVMDITKEQSDVTFQLDDRFKDRCRGVLEDYEEFGYI